MRIALASDHAGYPLKQHLLEYLRKEGHEVVDLGVDTADVPSDYPDVAETISLAVLEGRAERGLLLCGSGVGACIAANKFQGIYACVCHDTYSAHQGVEHDRMNIMCIGARVVGPAMAEELANAFLKAMPSEEERHVRRFGKLQRLEQRHL